MVGYDFWGTRVQDTNTILALIQKKLVYDEEE
jgi:hypothetical protein